MVSNNSMVGKSIEQLPVNTPPIYRDAAGANMGMKPLGGSGGGSGGGVNMMKYKQVVTTALSPTGDASTGLSPMVESGCKLASSDGSPLSPKRSKVPEATLGYVPSGSVGS